MLTTTKGFALITCGLDCPHEKNSHHVLFPASAYKHGLDKKFRELPCNIEKMCIEVHKELHRILNPPPKPSASFMRKAIQWHKQKKCRCYRKTTWQSSPT